MGLADWGRKEISIADFEMPGLISNRKKYAPANPLKGVRADCGSAAHDHFPDRGAD